jgi:hypothetical protein
MPDHGLGAVLLSKRHTFKSFVAISKQVYSGQVEILFGVLGLFAGHDNASYPGVIICPGIGRGQRLTVNSFTVLSRSLILEL